MKGGNKLPIDFRLAYNAGLNYIDLFPQTSMTAILDGDSLLSYSTLNVTIPAPTGNPQIQTISITTTAEQNKAPFYVFLVSTGTQAQADYNTIDQIQVTSNQLSVVRLNNWPVGEIEIILFFLESGV